ncbi:hypothetical protein CC1G_01910 [Coprinopsis cinerea okayama7|uniref:Gelsolin n=1 Tax=Coprinopsis cinerea (strain Okayama-7 / 130 / ATCC MYA-4618 / FGSC 9003) TaxID=240176 RepID=A8N5X9_COPC7|nr:hypothetical protein CC1G_01910 [Coprinopsis cinerea okayama7\|eukprot:XP_001830274.2 hypothetical protein CC1G_01910 [Coprinopsis cinerea okayama7\
MDSSRSYVRRSLVDYPKPESDLAEWATKIKALQRQVDADEEAEQKRLEAEIQAARQARLRRSRRFSGRGLNLDSSPSGGSDKWNLASPTTDVLSDDRPRDSADRYGHQNEALKKLMGNNAVHVPPKAPNEAVSLASFIGGRATGPRLNKHSAQQDAHDPTQFNQPDTSTPHPIFGKGGVAMPGMVSKQDLNNGRIPPKPACSSSLSTSKTDQPKSNNLRAPATATERRRSLSPTPAVGTEDFERYRPSASPTPKSPLKARKSSESVKETSHKDNGGYRYSIVGHSLRSQKSSERVGSPGLRSQKSSERIAPPVVGSEDFERYRPSTSPQPSVLKSQKSVSTFSSSGTAEKQRPLSSSGFYGNTRSTSPTKPFGRSSPEKRTSSRPASPEKPITRTYGFDAPKSAVPELKSQNSWSRDPSKSSTPVNPVASEKAASSVSRQTNNRTPPVMAPRPISYLSTTTPSIRERTISTPNFLPKSPIATHTPSRSIVNPPPSLARPIQPEPRVPTNVPILPAAAVVPSPAFRKQETAKDLSPSISRLQGRGFVQNMVKASLQLESQSAPTSVQATPVEKGRQASGGKKSVLDRWQPHMRSPSPPPSPTKSQTPVQVRRAATTDPNVTKLAESRSVAASPAPVPTVQQSGQQQFPGSSSREPLTPRTTARYIEKMSAPTGKIGSATTMFVEKLPSSPSISAVDELGVKHEIPRSQLAGRQKHHIPSEIPGPTGKPLIHPTKNRAKRPKKNSTNATIGGRLTEEPEEIKQQGKPAPSPVPNSFNMPQPSRTTIPESHVRSDAKISRLAEAWSNNGPILPRHTPTERPSEDISSARETKKYPGLRHALPGMAKEPSFRPRTPEMKTPPQSMSPSMDRAPSSPRPRIPSTGSRATVMEVAQALQERAQTPEAPPPPAVSETPPIPDEDHAPVPPRLRPAPSSQAEKRKSSYDRFSVITLPPLKEEATPAPSPAGTLTRTKEFIHPISSEPRTPKEPKEVSITHNDLPLPQVDVSVMFHPISPSSLIPPDSRTISVDVMSVSGTSTTTLTEDIAIFYDTEVLAVVHRSKSQPSGLVDTFVWCWLGKRSQYGEKEEKKVQEIARRYGTTAIIVRQYSESAHLIGLVGGRLAIRQGSRAHWSPENTAMHLVRSTRGLITIDEHDLSIKNLCSAFSYCVTLLNTVYIWHGSGSSATEREAATDYAQQLANGGAIIELFEGKESEGDDSMFWMILGDDAYANADYWKWRGSVPSADPTMWRVDANKRVNTLVPVEFFSQVANPCQSVYIANCIWELFILVGPDARGSRRDIRLALEVALEFAKRASAERPFTPNVHVVILPSKLPLDLRLHFRDLDEELLNHNNIPDHMNLVSSEEALAQLQNTSWSPDDLKDHQMLPLGLDVMHSIRPQA